MVNFEWAEDGYGITTAVNLKLIMICGWTCRKQLVWFMQYGSKKEKDGRQLRWSVDLQKVMETWWVAVCPDLASRVTAASLHPTKPAHKDALQAVGLETYLNSWIWSFGQFLRQMANEWWSGMKLATSLQTLLKLPCSRLAIRQSYGSHDSMFMKHKWKISLCKNF